MSLSLRTPHAVDLDAFNLWVYGVLEQHGASIYRHKGVLNVHGDDRRYVFQGVHMVFTGRPSKQEWGAEGEAEGGRSCQLVMIGKSLPMKELEDGFRQCLAGDGKKGRESLLVE